MSIPASQHANSAGIFRWTLDLTGGSWRDESLVFPHGEAHFLSQLEAAEDSPLDCEVLVGGALRWLRVIPERLSDGRLRCTGVDITSEKNAAIAVAANSNYFRHLLDNPNRAVLCWNADGILRQANAKAAELLGMPVESLMGISAAATRWRLFDASGNLVPSPALHTLRTGEPVLSAEMILEVVGQRRTVLVDTFVEYGFAGAAPVHVYTAITDLTDHRRRADAAEHRAESLAAAQARARFGSWELYPGQNSGTWSEELFALFGRDPRLGVPGFDEFLAMVSPEHHGRFEAVHREVLELGRTGSVEFRTTDARWFRCDLAPIQRDGMTGMGGTVLDITQGKEAEVRAQESARMLRTIVARAPIGIILVDRELRCLEVSQRWIGDRRLIRDEAVGRLLTEVFPEAPPQWKEAYRRALAGETLRGSGTPLAGLAGHQYFIDWEMQPWGGRESADGGMILYVEDVTDRTRWGNELRASEERWQFALEGSGDGVWDWSAETGDTFYSPQFKRILGYQDSEFPNQSSFWADLIHPEDRERVLSRLNRHLQRETASYESEHRMRCKDGQYLWVLERGKVISGTPEGRPRRVIGTGADISERKQAEAEIRHLVGLYEALSSVNQAIVRHHRREDLFSEVARALVESGGFSGVNIRFEDPAAPGTETVICHGELLSNAVPVSLAIRSHGRVAGTMLVYGGRQTLLSRRHIGLLQEAASDVAYALDNMEKDRRRQEAEEALRASEARLAMALDAAGLAIWDFDLLTGNMVWTGRLDRALGLDTARIEGPANRVNWIHPDDLAGLKEAALRAKDSRDMLATECRTIWPDGSVHWLSSQGRYQYDEQGRAIRMVGVSGDITERKKTEVSLAESLERLSLAQTGGQLGCFDLDRRTGRFFWTPELERLHGLEPGTFDGTIRGVLRRIYPPDLPIALSRANYWDTSKAQRDELTYRIVLPTGEIRWIESRCKLIRDADGTILRVVGTNSDITDRIRAAEEKHRLEHQLVQAQKMESIGRLAGGIAHDFNNLLTVIRGYSDWLLTRQAPDDPDRPAIAEISQAGERATLLVRQLLAFSRKQVLAKEVLDLNDVIQQAARMVSRMVGEDVELSLRLAPDLPRILADRNQLEQVILNLAVNARDAMPDGGVLTIETAPPGRPLESLLTIGEPPASDCIRMSVRDTGTGIAPEILPNLFEPFFTTKDVGKGTGLGLATVQGIVLQSGGYLSVDAGSDGRGAAFHIYLPLVGTRETPKPLAPQVPANYPRGSETILLVDDQIEVRRFAAAVLEGCGYRVIVTSSGDEALAELRSRRDIDLVLSDIVMPRLSGNHLSAWIREHWPQLPVVLMTGNAEKSAGVEAYGGLVIEKPFSPEALATKVREALGPLKPRVLVVGDDPDVRRFLEMALRRGGCRTAESDGEAAEVQLAEMRPDVVVADLPLVSSGEAAVAAYRKRSAGRVVGVSSVDRRDLDCIMAKPVSVTDLVSAVKRIAGAA